MSKLGDLIVRLFLDKKDYEKGLSSAKSQTSGFGNVLKKIWSTAVAKIGAAAVAVKGYIKIQNELAHTTQTLGDAWDRNVAGMKEAWETFKNSLATSDFSGLVGRMNEAYQAASDLAKAEDAIGEAQTAAAIESARHLEENISLMEQARNSTLDAFDRISAITKLQENIESEHKGLVEAFGKAGEEAIDLFLVKAQKGLQSNDITDEMREDVLDFLVWMGNQGDNFLEASQILDLETEINNLGTAISQNFAKGIDTTAQQEAVKQLREKLAALTKEYVKNGGEESKLNMLRGYNAAITDRLRKKIEQYIPAAMQQANAAKSQTLRFTNLRNSILGSAKSLSVFNKLLGALPESLKEKLNIQGAKDYTGEIDAEVKAILDMQSKLANGAIGGDGGGGGKTYGSRTAQGKYQESLKKIREEWEKYDRWSKSKDARIQDEARKLYEKLSKDAGSYYAYLLKERKKFYDKLDAGKKLSAVEKDQLEILNEEILKASPFKDVKWDNVKLEKFKDDVVDLTDALEDLGDLDIDMPLPDPHGMFETLDEWVKWMEECRDKAKELSEDFRRSIASGFSAGIEELMEGLMGVQEINAGSVMKALLTPLAESVISAGEMIMAQGIATEAFKTSLTSLNGYAAIAAGAALIAAGSAAKAGLAAIAKGGAASSAAVDAAGASSSGIEKYRTELTIYVSGKLSGSDIILSGQKTLDSWGR